MINKIVRKIHPHPLGGAQNSGPAPKALYGLQPDPFTKEMKLQYAGVGQPINTHDKVFAEDHNGVMQPYSPGTEVFEGGRYVSDDGGDTVTNFSTDESGVDLSPVPKAVSEANYTLVNGGKLSFITPDPSTQFKVITADGQPWYLNGEYVDSNVDHSLDAGSDIPYGLDIGQTAVSAWFWNNWGATDLTLNIEDMYGWALTGTASFYDTNVTGDIANTGWALTGSAYFYNTAVTGDIANTGWALTGTASLANTNVTGDIANTGWALTGTASFYNTNVTACSSELTWLSTNIRLDGCQITDPTHIDNILIGIDNAGQSNGALNVSGGTNAIPTAAGLTAKSNLEGRGWTVTVNS